MNRKLAVALCALALAASVVLLNMSCGGGSTTSNNTPPTPPPNSAGKIKHVVIIFQENRTPDNLFHDPALIAAGADISSTELTSTGQTVTMQPGSLGVPYDLSHAHDAFKRMYDNGHMDGADLIQVSCSPGYTGCPPANPHFIYVKAADVSPYFQMAEQYTFGDRMFQTNEGPSFPAHQFIFSGTSAPTQTSNLFISENPNTQPAAGCISPPDSLVTLIGPDGVEGDKIYPCVDHQTLADELTAQNVSWRFYTPTYDYIWTSPTAIEHLCVPNAAPPNATACTGSAFNNVIQYTTKNPAPILTDIASNNLATVSWVIPSAPNSDHASNPAWIGGPSWVASIVNAIGNSPYWSNTAIIVAWDDWGGWPDHVPPPKVIADGVSWGSGYVYGFRVPLIVISPYAKAAYISHTNHDFGSILNFIEQTYGLGQLGWADSNTTDALADCFNFSQTPLTFKNISAPMDAKHFLTDRTPPEGPDND
ncbi:MAG TPA: alkaline phosphatase family protein [Terriglobales bacterium]